MDRGVFGSTPACGAEGAGSIPVGPIALVAQWIRQARSKGEIVGSNPAEGISEIASNTHDQSLF